MCPYEKVRNLLAMIDKIVINNSGEKRSEISIKNKIYNRRLMRTKNFDDLILFVGWKIKNFFKNF